MAYDPSTGAWQAEYDWLGNPVAEPKVDPWSGAPSVNFGSLSQIPNMNYYQDPTSGKYYVLGSPMGGPTGVGNYSTMTGDLSSWGPWSNVNIAGTPDVATGWGVPGATGTNRAYEFASDPQAQFRKSPPTESGTGFSLKNLLALPGSNVEQFARETVSENPAPMALIGGAIGGFAAGAGALGGVGGELVGGEVAGAYGPGEFGTGLSQTGLNTAGTGSLSEIVGGEMTGPYGPGEYPAPTPGIQPDFTLPDMPPTPPVPPGEPPTPPSSLPDVPPIPPVPPGDTGPTGYPEGQDTPTPTPQGGPDVPTPTTPTDTNWLKELNDWIKNNPYSEIAKMLGPLLATGLGIYGSDKQADALRDLGNQYTGFGAPSRGRYEAAMTPGFDPTSIPGYAGALDTASNSILSRLSASGGNPYGNPGGLISANKAIVSGTALPAINEYTRQNANVGFGNSMSAAQNFQTAGVGADANVYNALGFGLNQIFNPQPTLMDIYKIIAQNKYRPSGATEPG